MCVSVALLRKLPGGEHVNVGDGGALTDEFCSTDDDCMEVRKCRTLVGSEFVPCGTSWPCTCTPDEYVECKRHADCVTAGEKCARQAGPPGGVQRCVAEVVIEHDPRLVPFDEEEGVKTDRVTGDFCRLGLCKGERTCVDASDAGKRIVCEKEQEEEECICIPETLQTCVDARDCQEAGETCGRFASGEQLCFSRTRVANTDITEVLPEISVGNGFTFDQCSETTVCKGDRTCVRTVPGSVETCGSSKGCFCRPPDLTRCDADTDCETPDEKCGVTRDKDPVCQSATVISGNNDVRGVNDPPPSDDDDSPSAPQPPVEVPEGGLTGDSCTIDAECRGIRTCNMVQDDVIQGCVRGETQCRCYPLVPRLCGSDSECEPGERCAVFEEPGVKPFCVSQARIAESDAIQFLEGDKPTPTADAAGGQVKEDGSAPQAITADAADASCVDARALSHLRANELVFRSHRRARVLCDGAGSCATAGHIVVFRGRGMCMRTYCGMVGCTAGLMEVNSPKWRRGTRVRSRTEGLLYTAYAARWATWAEEGVLTALVRAGM